MMVDCFCPNITEEEFQAWDMREHDWTGKIFYQVRVPMISHFPVAPELKIPKVLADIEDEGLVPAAPPLIVYNDGMLIGSLMVEVAPTSGKHSNIITMGPSKMISKAYKGPRHLVPKALKEFNRSLFSQDLIPSDYYFWFLTCKICNKKDRENKTIIFAKA